MYIECLCSQLGITSLNLTKEGSEFFEFAKGKAVLVSLIRNHTALEDIN